MGGAFANESSPNAHASAIFDRATSGSLTKADKAFLAANPDLATAVPDPSRTTTGQETFAVSGDGQRLTTAESAMASRCTATRRYQNHYSWLGSLSYRFNTYVYWCWSGSRITQVSPYYSYFSDKDSAWYIQGAIPNGRFYYSSNHWQVTGSGVIDNCILKYGCIGEIAPWNHVDVYAGGTNHFSWRQ